MYTNVNLYKTMLVNKTSVFNIFGSLYLGFVSDKQHQYLFMKSYIYIYANRRPP